jgi:hypothetical protein
VYYLKFIDGDAVRFTLDCTQRPRHCRTCAPSKVCSGGSDGVGPSASLILFPLHQVGDSFTYYSIIRGSFA